MTDEILAEVRASPLRRWMGIGMLAMVGGIVIYVAFASPPAIGWQAFLLAVGAGALWMAERMRQATECAILLTEEEIVDSSGLVLARIDDIQAIDRGLFAFKPSNGFLLKLRDPSPGVWRPGLWWRTGRRVGIGGVTPASQTKVMSEMLSAMLAQRG